MLQGPNPGRVIAGKYRLIERVGVGGMSEVHRAEELGTGRVVALKLLLPQRTEDPNLAARMFQEAQSVQRIRHPGIVEVLDVGRAEAGPFIVMEYLDGQSAGHTLLAQGKLGLFCALAIMLPVLDALQAAHDAGVIHRDLKPANIFLASDENGSVKVKLLDFGVAKMTWPTGPSPLTSTGIVMGTPDYLSPEQANGAFTIDGRSDVFAAGVVLFELLTGVRPFHASTTVATAYRIAHARTPVLCDHGGPSEPALQAILERALAKRPEERYPSARQFAAELETLAAPRETMEQALRGVSRPRAGSGIRPAGLAPSGGTTGPSEPDAGRMSWPGIWPFTADSSPASEVSTARHVRGLVLRAAEDYLGLRLGTDARRRILGAISGELARELEYRSVQGIVMYEVDPVNGYLDAVTHELGDNPTWARAAGETAATGELAALLKAATRPDELATVLRRVVSVLSRLLDFGHWELEPTGRAITLRIDGLEPLGLPLRLWLVGALDGALAAAGSTARGIIARGDVGSSPQLVVDFVSG